MALDEPLQHEKTYNINEVEVIIADGVLPYTEGNMLDFVNDQRGQGFILGPIDGGGDCSCGDESESDCDCSETGECSCN